MFPRKANKIIYLGVALTLAYTLAAAPATALAQQGSDSSSSNGTTNLGTLVVAPQRAPNNASAPKPDLRVQRHSLRLNLGQGIAPQPTNAGTTTPSPQPQPPQAQQPPQDQDQEPAMVRRQPSPLHIVQPQYPAIAYKSRLKGTVTVSFTIGTDGSTSRIRVVGSEPPGIFDHAAREAVKQWTFQPATVNGLPVAERVRQTLVFRPPTNKASREPRHTAPKAMRHSGMPPANFVPHNIHPVHLVPPQYPSAAYRRNEGGKVTVSFLVEPNGHTSHIRLVYSNPRHTFDNAAMNAVRKWRFDPVSKPTKVVQTIKFTPPN